MANASESFSDVFSQKNPPILSGHENQSICQHVLPLRNELISDRDASIKILPSASMGKPRGWYRETNDRLLADTRELTDVPGRVTRCLVTVLRSANKITRKSSAVVNHVPGIVSSALAKIKWLQRLAKRRCKSHRPRPLFLACSL